MSKKPLILGIESSCDETAASLITENEEGFPVVLSNIVSSQVEVHREFGGVVPELAARSHIEKIDWIVKKAIDESGRKIEEIDAVASTAGPGLIVCLSVGLSFGKAFATAMNKPFIAVNHLEGHALSPKLNTNLNYPYLLLLISGGHSQYLSVRNLGKYKRLGTTIDDALGEAFDKTAKLLGIEFPGGPQIEILAKKGDPEKYDLPKPIFNKGGCNLSFAGLKTAILKISKTIKSEQDKCDLAASFQKTIEEILYKKTKIAFTEFEKINEYTLFENLDKRSIDFLGSFNKNQRSKLFPIGVVPYTIIIKKNKELINSARTSWDFLLSEKLTKKIIFPQSPRIILSIAQKINSSNALKKLKSQAMLFDDKNMLNWLINSDACIAIVPYSLCSKYLKIDPRLSLVFPSQGVPLMWHFILSRSNLKNQILIKWIKSLENKSIVDKLVSEGWYLPFNSDYLQNKYKSEIYPISGPSKKCWDNSWSFPPLTNEQKINLKNFWNESLSP